MVSVKSAHRFPLTPALTLSSLANAVAPWLNLAVAATEVELKQLAAALAALGCPAEKSAAMAAQLDKRARQLAAEKGRPYEAALTHLLNLMRQGWAAPKN